VGCSWATIDVEVAVDGDVKTTCQARIALPADDDDNPWTRKGADWIPEKMAEDG
jgi:hypothetical protein